MIDCAIRECMDTLIKWIVDHAGHAHWYIFIAIVLAGFNIPLCLDLLVLVSAFIAATILPQHLWHLFFSVLLGCLCSAACAYWLGRLCGHHLQHMLLFRSLLSAERMQKMRLFYERHGLWTLIIGRFIPFGVRNCLFMTTGASRLKFTRFILMDIPACLIWCTTAFYLFYQLGHHYSQIWRFMKTFNLIIFSIFSVALIAAVWYIKKKKKSRHA